MRSSTCFILVFCKLTTKLGASDTTDLKGYGFEVLARLLTSTKLRRATVSIVRCRNTAKHLNEPVRRSGSRIHVMTGTTLRDTLYSSFQRPGSPGHRRLSPDSNISWRPLVSGTATANSPQRPYPNNEEEIFEVRSFTGTTVLDSQHEDLLWGIPPHSPSPD